MAKKKPETPAKKVSRRAAPAREMREPKRDREGGIIHGHGHAPPRSDPSETPAARRRRLEALPSFQEQARRDRIRDAANRSTV
jgi:hypothetical protein